MSAPDTNTVGCALRNSTARTRVVTVEPLADMRELLVHRVVERVHRRPVDDHLGDAVGDLDAQELGRRSVKKGT